MDETVNNAILEYRLLAINYAKRFSRSLLHMRGDMISEALLTLTIAAHEHLDHPNFEAYLRVRLRGALLDMLRRRENNVPYDDISSCNDNYMDMYMREIAALQFFNLEELQIIKMRIDGYTDQEIAESFGVWPSAIRKRRVAICQKILTQGEQYGFNRCKESLLSRKRSNRQSSGRNPFGHTSDTSTGSINKEIAR